MFHSQSEDKMFMSREALYVYSLNVIYKPTNFFLVSLNCELSFWLKAEACKFDLFFSPNSFFSYRRKKTEF